VLAAADDGTAATFASWDEAEECLERMQRAGLLPHVEFQAGELETGVELRIIDLDHTRPSRSRAA
jgi:hypothetical protein